MTVNEKFTMYPSLANQHVLISGGASGIGAALVEAFYRQGASVSFLDIDEQAASALLEQLEKKQQMAKTTSATSLPRFFHVDITDIGALQSTLAQVEKKHGAVNSLLNNAAKDTRYALGDITVQIWEEMQRVNLAHVLFTTQALAPSMREAGGGSVINFTSTSFVKRSPQLTAYGTFKAGIIGLTRTLSRDLGESNIRVNAIMPGWIMTERQRSLWLTPELETEIMRQQSLKRFIEPAEVAKLALFLASDQSTMISAQTYVIDGGWV